MRLEPGPLIYIKVYGLMRSGTTIVSRAIGRKVFGQVSLNEKSIGAGDPGAKKSRTVKKVESRLPWHNPGELSKSMKSYNEVKTFWRSKEYEQV